MQIVSHEVNVFWVWQCCDFLDELVSVHPLLLWILKQKGLRLKVEHSLVIFVCYD